MSISGDRCENITALCLRMPELAPRSVQKSPTLVLRTVTSLGDQQMTVELAQSSRSKLVSTGVVATVLRSLVEIGAVIKGLFRASHPALAERRTESASLETESVATPKFPPTRKSKRMLRSALSPALNSTGRKSSVDATW